MNKTITFEVAKTEVFQGLNEDFILCKCHVSDFSQIANGFKFTKESFEKSASNWAYLPVLGEWSSDGNGGGTFGGHGGRHIISENGDYEYEKTTIAYGCILNTPARFENVTMLNGDVKEMWTVDLVLWNGRYQDELKVFANGGTLKQSMEIVINSSHYDDNYIDIVEDFTPSALCILGEGVNPAFKDSKIIPAANFSTTNFDELVSRVKQLEDKFTTKFNKKEGDSVNFEEMYNELKTQFEELETKHSQLETQYSEQEEEFTKKKRKCEEYEETIATHETSMNEMKAEYEEKVGSLNGELDTVKAQYEESQTKYSELETQFNEVNTKYQEKMSAEELAAKEELVGTFTEILTDAEIKATVGTDLTQFTLEEIDTKLSIAVGKKSKERFSKTKKPDQPQVFTDFGMGTYSEFSKMAEEIRARKNL
ncbi:MAG: hypothetical protein ACRC1P_11415 [Cellulosilyticaceae bacterium]